MVLMIVVMVVVMVVMVWMTVSMMVERVLASYSLHKHPYPYSKY